MKTAILQLKKFVCTCAIAGAVAAKRVSETSGMERWGHWADKRDAGWPTRHALLAYAFARSVPYASLEAKNRDGNAPSAERVEAWLKEAGVPFEPGAVEAWMAARDAEAESEKAA
jgi:hypothetical protein